MGKDRVQISTSDDRAAITAIRERFEIEAAIHEGLVTFNVELGEHFVPRLFAELPQQIRSVSVARPTLDDVFMSCTGRTIRDSEATASEREIDPVTAAIRVSVPDRGLRRICARSASSGAGS